MKQKFTTLLLLIASILCLLSTCKKEEDPETEAETVLEVNKGKLHFDWNDEEENIKITCNTNWFIEVSDDWCEPSVFKGSGDKSIVIMADRNTSSSSRKATITITAKDKKAEITIRQDGKESKTPSTEEETPTYKMTLSATEGGTTKQTVSSNGAFTTIEAIAYPGYIFSRWSDGNTYEKRTITLDKDKSLQAIFTKNITYYTVKTAVKPAGVTTIIGAGTYEAGTTIVVKANHPKGYTFKGWSNGAKTEDVTITITSDIMLTAEFLEYENIDLKLPSGTLWATCNIGAEDFDPENLGEYYAWGETTTKKTFNLNNYKLCNTSGYTKYCKDGNIGIYDNKTQLEASDDVATVSWGDHWRMPTKAEVAELLGNCTWSNVNGHIVGESKINHEKIIFPLSGYKIETELERDMTAIIATSELSDRSDCPWAMWIGIDGSKQGFSPYSSKKESFWFRRQYGFQVRAVKK